MKMMLRTVCCVCLSLSHPIEKHRVQIIRPPKDLVSFSRLLNFFLKGYDVKLNGLTSRLDHDDLMEYAIVFTQWQEQTGYAREILEQVWSLSIIPKVVFLKNIEDKAHQNYKYAKKNPC